MNQSEIREAIKRTRSVIMRTRGGVVEPDDVTQFRRSFDELADGLPGLPLFNTHLRYFRLMMRDCGLFSEPPRSLDRSERLSAEADDLLGRIDNGDLA